MADAATVGALPENRWLKTGAALVRGRPPRRIALPDCIAADSLISKWFCPIAAWRSGRLPAADGMMATECNFPDGAATAMNVKH